ncbi:MAG: PAS domain S-box protein, partial [Planctomycetales bacterium]|nr:PAS domain S-box protein [Planctomycetales bacterium]
MQRDLRDSDDGFRQILEAVSDGWWQWDLVTGELHVSDRWLISWGYSRDEFQPHVSAWQALVHPDDWEHLQKALHDHVRGAALVYECEYRIRTKSGEWAWSLDRGKVVKFDADGRPLMMVGTDTNITDRKRAEFELHETERRLQQIVDNTSAVIYVKDAQYRYLMINRRFEELFGVTNAGLRGRDDFMIFPPEAAAGFRRNDERVLATGETMFVDEIAPHEDGPHTYISVKFPLRDAHGRIHAMAGISTDITERKRAEEALAHYAEELERSNRDLRVFAYAASHDLQEPLRAIAGYGQLLHHRYRGTLDAEADRWIDLIIDGVKRMNLLLSDLLDYSRINTQARQFEPVDTGQALRDALANLAASIGERQAIITHDDLPTIAADRLQMTQLFQNLIGNAIKYCQVQPHVQVSAERLAATRQWRFAVRDNGI